MAALFRDFSFAAPSPSLADHEAERASMNCSPTSTPTAPDLAYRPLTPPPCTMGDLAQLLGGPRLVISTSRAHHIPPGPPTPPSDDDTFTSAPREPRAARPTYCRASASIMRMQRQANVRLQCCASQARDISRLVRMVQGGEQCNISAPDARSASAASAASASAAAAAAMTAGDDEAIDMDYDCSPPATEPLFSPPPYRAGDRHSDHARVSKNVRMRKRSSAARETTERRKTK